MKKEFVEVVFILDRSGSMHGLEDDTIGGFNSMLEKEKLEERKALVSTILFNDKITSIYNRLNINDVPKLTRKDYCTAGCTALLDAVGSTINNISYLQLNDDEKPIKTIFFIITDGYENSSVEFSYSKIKYLIKKYNEIGWEFIFLAANLDAAKEGEKLGICRENSVNYHNDEVGIKKIYASVGRAIKCCISSNPKERRAWRDNLDRDFKSRKR